jgi:hypothetical protein
MSPSPSVLMQTFLFMPIIALIKPLVGRRYIGLFIVQLFWTIGIYYYTFKYFEVSNVIVFVIGLIVMRTVLGGYTSGKST